MQQGLHHLHMRKRIYTHVSPYPHPTYWKRILDYLMYVVAIGSPLALLPQIFQIYGTRDAGGVSLMSFTLFAALNALWTVYAMTHRDLPLTIASAIFAALDVVIVVGILLY